MKLKEPCVLIGFLDREKHRADVRLELREVGGADLVQLRDVPMVDGKKVKGEE